MKNIKNKKSIIIVIILGLLTLNFHYTYSEEVSINYVPSEIIIKTKGNEIDILKKFNISEFELIDSRVYRLKSNTIVNVKKVIDKYSKNKDIEVIEPNYLLRAVLSPNDNLFSYQWGLHNTGQTVNNITGKSGIDIRAVEAWDMSLGNENLKIAVFDTGVNYNHEDLIGRTVAGYDFVNNDSDPIDDNGHGTMVSGVIGAAANNGKGIAGIDWKAKVMPVKILDANGMGTISNLIQGINYAANNGVKVINMSLVGNYSETLNDSIKNAYDNGIVMVSAAGNDSVNLNVTKMSPISNDGTDNWVIGVGSINQNGLASSFSNFGSQYIDVVAPGENIISAYNSGNGSYAYGSGTSLSAGFVSGVAGLVLNKYNNNSVGVVRQKIVNKSDDLGLGDSFGKGNINGKKALIGKSKKIGAMKKEAGNDYNFYVYEAPANMSAQVLTGYDLWNIPSGDNAAAITGVDIDGDGVKELAVMKNESGDYNLYIYNYPSGPSSQPIRAADLWNIPSGDNVVAIAGVDYNGDGKDEIAVMKNEGGDYNMYIYFAPTTIEATFLIGGDKWNIPSGDNTMAMTGVDVDGDGKDEIAVMKNEGGDYNLYIYRAPNGMEPTAIVGIDKWNIPSGDNAIGITGIDIDEDGIDELGVMKNEGGDYNFYIYRSPIGTGAMSLIAGDKWNIPSGDNVVGIATVE